MACLLVCARPAQRCTSPRGDLVLRQPSSALSQAGHTRRSVETTGTEQSPFGVAACLSGRRPQDGKQGCERTWFGVLITVLLAACSSGSRARVPEAAPDSSPAAHHPSTQSAAPKGTEEPIKVTGKAHPHRARRSPHEDQPHAHSGWGSDAGHDARLGQQPAPVPSVVTAETPHWSFQPGAARVNGTARWNSSVFASETALSGATLPCWHTSPLARPDRRAFWGAYVSICTMS